MKKTRVSSHQNIHIVNQLHYFVDGEKCSKRTDYWEIQFESNKSWPSESLKYFANLRARRCFINCKGLPSCLLQL